MSHHRYAEPVSGHDPGEHHKTSFRKKGRKASSSSGYACPRIAREDLYDIGEVPERKIPPELTRVNPLVGDGEPLEYVLFNPSPRTDPETIASSLGKEAELLVYGDTRKNVSPSSPASEGNRRHSSLFAVRRVLPSADGLMQGLIHRENYITPHKKKVTGDKNIFDANLTAITKSKRPVFL
jgi:hypothetical protein